MEDKDFYSIISAYNNPIKRKALTWLFHAFKPLLNKMTQEFKRELETVDTKFTKELDTREQIINQLQAERENLQERLVTVEDNIRSNNKRIESLNTYEFSNYSSIDYASFEQHFRGDEKLIQQRQKEYLPYFKDCRHVLDIGCGRGEFLEVLRDNGINASGIDLYQPYVTYCEEKGLNVKCGDGIELLKKEHEIDGIFAAQLVEHLSWNQIMNLLSISAQKLPEGGKLIIETPNPMSLYTFTHAFYIDPTHKRPIHPLTLQYLAMRCGFKEAKILFTKGSKPDIPLPEFALLNDDADKDKIKNIINSMLFGSQDYAIIAEK